MFVSRSVLLLTLAAVGASAFSPAARSSVSVAQFVEEHQRYQPRSSPIFVGETIDDDVDILDSLLPDVDSPPEDDYIVNVGDLEQDDNDGIEDDGEDPAWYASAQRMNDLRDTYKRGPNDTGSPEYQVAGMTERISYLTMHLQKNPKDFSTRRGLVAMVNKRRRLLNYLFQEDGSRYFSLIQSMGIRHKPPGRVPSREETYSRFPRQKATKKHLVNRKK